MHHDRELTRLAARKTALRRDIAARRLHCAEVAARVTWPLEWLDRLLAVGRRVPPLTLLAAIPVGCLVTRSIFSGLKTMGSFVSGVLRGVGFAVRAASGPPRPSDDP
jgi:hypothetical protein